MTIRQFHEKDMKPVLEIETETFPETGFSERQFRSYGVEDRATFLVYEENGETIGYVIFSSDTSSSTVYLASLAVESQYRRRGIGTELMRRAMEAARTRGAQRMTLHVRTSNDGAIEFYRGLGFGIRATVPGYYRDEDAYRMALKL